MALSVRGTFVPVLKDASSFASQYSCCSSGTALTSWDLFFTSPTEIAQLRTRAVLQVAFVSKVREIAFAACQAFVVTFALLVDISQITSFVDTFALTVAFLAMVYGASF
jgi:hypothetical protein